MKISLPYIVKKAPGDGQFGTTLKEKRMGVMLHYDGSTSDAGGLGWFADPGCTVSYQDGVDDAGVVHEIAPASARAWHAGVCRSSDPRRLPYVDANSAFYGVAILTNEKTGATILQTLVVAARVRHYFAKEGWPVTETWRIVGHDTEAWPRGRKIDPTGPAPANPILSVADIRRLLPLVET
jgi:N-acetyl-anhydromuramyl-L-alanine amidase AmpD